jgi:hypothetical protein
MFKKFLTILLLVSPFVSVDAVVQQRDAADALEWDREEIAFWAHENVDVKKGGCKKYTNLNVCNLIRTGSLIVAGNTTIGGTLTVSGASSFAAPVTIGGVTALTALRSYGQAYSTAGLAGPVTAGPIVFAAGSTINSGIIVAGPAITLTNIGVYYVRYSMLFLNSGAVDTSSATMVPTLNAGLLPTGSAGYIASVNFGTTNTEIGETSELSGGFFVATTTASSVLAFGVTLTGDASIPATTAPSAGVTVEIIQVN